MKKRLQRVYSLLLAAILLLACGPVNALASVDTVITGETIREAGSERNTISGEIRSGTSITSGGLSHNASQNVIVQKEPITRPVVPTTVPVPSSTGETLETDATPETDRIPGTDITPAESFPSDSMEAAENDVEFSLDDVTAQAGKKVSLNLSLTKSEWAISSATVRVYFRPDFLTFDNASVEQDKDGQDTDWKAFKQAIESIEDASVAGYVTFDTNNEDNRQSITFHYQIDSESALGFTGLGTLGSLTFQVAESVPAGATIPMELEVVDAAWSALDEFDESLTFGVLHMGKQQGNHSFRRQSAG